MTVSSRPKIGVLGAGQLALMLAEAGRALDVDVLCAGQPGDCAQAQATVVPTDLADSRSVAAFAGIVDRVTIESENIDASIVEGLVLYPNTRALGIAQDRLLEKQFFRACGIEVAPFAPVSGLGDLEAALPQIGLPAILKTRRMGYDGKGQVRLSNASEVAGAWQAVEGVPCILEGMVEFNAEVSLLAARGVDGDIVFYPLVENHHRDGILRTTIAPYAGTSAGELQSIAEACLTRLLIALDYVGVLAVEFFVTATQLIANEMAPRVHNSGHWTIEGATTSQFANHLRAVLGYPLGDTSSRPTVMLNCIGDMPALEETARFASVARHDYGKQPRPGRKVGHLTLPASAADDIAYWRHILEAQR